MALKDKMMQQEQPQEGVETLTPEEDKDLEIMVNMSKNLIDDGGYEIIEKAQKSKDPAIVIGQFLMQLGAQLAEKLPFDPSPRVMLAVGGWVEQISDYIQEEYGVPRKIMDRAEIYVATSAQQMGQAGQAPQGQPPQEGMPPQQGQPVMPQQPAPEQMGGM